jgi:hypothetical protein
MPTASITWKAFGARVWNNSCAYNYRLAERVRYAAGTIRAGLAASTDRRS